VQRQPARKIRERFRRINRRDGRDLALIPDLQHGALASSVDIPWRSRTTPRDRWPKSQNGADDTTPELRAQHLFVSHVAPSATSVRDGALVSWTPVDEVWRLRLER
jgi:hypothetical protein